MNGGLTHTTAFHGSVRWAELEIADDDLVVTDGDCPALLTDRNGIAVGGQRPNRQEFEAAAEAIRTGAPERVVAVGGGCAIDTAKLAWLDTGPDDRPLVVAPCGREVWRAFAPFAVVLDPPGAQTTTVDARLSGIDVVIDHRLVAAIGDDTVLVTALDVLVAVVESLLSRKSQPLSRLLAAAAGTQLLAALGAGAAGERTDAEAVIAASALAAEAFTSTGLGLAHAISTNMAARLGAPQDRINAIAGTWVLARWWDHPALTALRRAGDSVGEPRRSVPELFEDCLARLQLTTLAAEGVAAGDVEAVLPRINESSGIPWLPEELDAGEIRRVVLDLCNPEVTGVRAGVG